MTKSQRRCGNCVHFGIFLCPKGQRGARPFDAPTMKTKRMPRVIFCPYYIPTKRQLKREEGR